MIIKLKTKIRGYDKAYRQGRPLISDQVFDSLVDQLKKMIPDSEFNEFRESLFETGGDIKHDYVIGSLRKTKAEDESFTVWMNKRKNNSILVAEKLDGCSIVLHFIDGKLFRAVTRGDGEYGVDQTDKLKLLIPTLKSDFTGQLRGEVLLTRTNLNKINEEIRFNNSIEQNPKQKNLRNEYKNPRNAVSGIIGQIDFDETLVKMLSVRVYQILGVDVDKSTQYRLLERLGVELPKIKVYPIGCTRENLVEDYTRWSAESDYDIDGVVVYDLTATDENVKLPDNTIAFKINDEAASTVYKGIEWNISKNGLYKPVILIDPVELNGATIERVTANNWRWVVDNKIGIGSIITIIRSGDVIPKMIDIIESNSPLEIPTVCIHCGTPLKTTDVELYCPNKDCDALGIKKVASFLRSCGVKGFTETTLEKFGIESIEDLIEFTANVRKSNEVKLMMALDDFVFNKQISDLVIHLPYTNFGTTLVKNILTAFNNDVDCIRSYKGQDNILVEQVSEERLSVFITQLNDLWNWVELIINDPRWSPEDAPVEEFKASNKFAGMSFCFTGNLDTMDRKDAERLVWANSGEVKGVSKQLTYLVNNDTFSTSSKNKKAKELGIKIISESEFLDMLK